MLCVETFTYLAFNVFQYILWNITFLNVSLHEEKGTVMRFSEFNDFVFAETEKYQSKEIVLWMDDEM